MNDYDHDHDHDHHDHEHGHGHHEHTLSYEDAVAQFRQVNLAYHPSCVYDSIFSCPLTPAENRLPIRVEAGERLSLN